MRRQNGYTGRVSADCASDRFKRIGPVAAPALLLCYCVGLPSCTKSTNPASVPIQTSPAGSSSGEPEAKIRKVGLSGELTNAVQKGGVVELDFALVNASNTSIVLAGRENGWGAYQWRFTVTEARGRTWQLTTPQTAWFGNALRVFSIALGATHLMHCKLNQDETTFKDGRTEIFSGVGFEATRPHSGEWSYPIALTGTFEAKLQKTAHASTNWQGKLTTNKIICERSSGAQSGTCAPRRR